MTAFGHGSRSSWSPACSGTCPWPPLGPGEGLRDEGGVGVETDGTVKEEDAQLTGDVAEGDASAARVLQRVHGVNWNAA